MFQAEQMEILKRASSPEAGLDFKETKQMEYLSKVCFLWLLNPREGMFSSDTQVMPSDLNFN